MYAFHFLSIYCYTITKNTMKLDLAKRLVNARTEKNLTQEKLSELSGVSVSEISRIENGRYSATVETLCRLSNALDVGLDSLLYDLFPKNTHIQNPDIQKVVSIMETMDEKHAKNVADIVYIYDRGHES